MTWGGFVSPRGSFGSGDWLGVDGGGESSGGELSGEQQGGGGLRCALGGNGTEGNECALRPSEGSKDWRVLALARWRGGATIGAEGRQCSGRAPGLVDEGGVQRRCDE